jgi:hypothetical protein
MRPRSPSRLALGAVVTVLTAGCSSHPSSYEEYPCPPPIGQIVREDCSKIALSYDGAAVEGKAGVGTFSVGGSYKDQAIREADNLIKVLKEQRVSLCNDFNTCKLTVDQYRQDKGRIESTFTAVVALKENAQKMDGSSAMAYLAQIRNIREGRGEPPAATVPATMSPGAQATSVPATSPGPQPPQQDAASFADWRPGKYMSQAVGLVADAARKLETNTSFGFDIDHACLLGAFVRTGANIDMTQTFSARRQYVLLGGGGEDAADIDLGILDANGKVLAADTDDDATPIVRFTPPQDGSYTIRLALPKSGSGGEFMAVAIMHEGGYSIPDTKIVQSFGRALSNAATASRNVRSRGNGGLIFHEQGNWSFYGTVLKPGEQSTFSGFTLTTDPTVVLASADDSGQNLDLQVNEAGSGSVVAKDTDPDATPLVVVHPVADRRYKVSISNSAPQGTTLATVLVLDVEK